jgi:hypothetical protein
MIEVLTEILDVLKENTVPADRYGKAIESLCQLIAELEKQEPVAFLTNRRQRLNVELNATGFTLMPKSIDWKIPLYTSPQPPQQEPVAYVDPIWMQRPDLVIAHQLEIGKLFARSQFKDYVPLYTKQDSKAKQ